MDGVGIRDLDIGDLPSRERPLDLAGWHREPRPRSAPGPSPRALAGALQRLLDPVDARDLPPAPCEPYAPDRASGADVERPAERRLPPLLLASDELEELVRVRRMLGEILPGGEPDRVGEPGVHLGLPSPSVSAVRRALTNAVGCSSGGSSPASSITWSGHP